MREAFGYDAVGFMEEPDHVTDGSPCWCDPETIDGVVVHNSADGREAYENGERKLN